VNPTCKPGNGSTKLGETKVQAALLSLEMCIIVDGRINSITERSRESRRFECGGRQQSWVRYGEY
jgi:hypothetical protein